MDITDTVENNNEKAGLPPAVVIICGFVTGIVITALLICVLLCKLKIRKAGRYSVKCAQRETPKKQQGVIQYTRSKGSIAEADGGRKINRWRSGYGKENDVKPNDFSESDWDVSSELTTSTSYEMSTQNEVLLKSPPALHVGKLVIVKQEAAIKSIAMVKQENKASNVGLKNEGSDNSVSKKSAASVINQATPKQVIDTKKWETFQHRFTSLKDGFKQQDNTQVILHVKETSLPGYADFETKSLSYLYDNHKTTNRLNSYQQASSEKAKQGSLIKVTEK